jgi:uncharacterized protein YggE
VIKQGAIGMKLIRAVTICLALLPAWAGAQNFQGKPFLAVQGHAEAKFKPDIFPLQVSISDTGTDAAKSQSLVEGLAKTVLAQTGKLKIPDADMEVGNLSISPDTDWDTETKTQIFKGNEYSRQIRVRFRSLDDLRAFIAAMPASPALRLETDSFEYSKAAEVKRKLRREAIEDGRKAGEEMASAVGKRLLDLFNVSDTAQSVVRSSSGYSGEGTTLDTVTVMGSAINADIVLREGEITISADAYLVYLIGN